MLAGLCVSDHGVLVKGTVSEQGSDGSSYDYTTQSHYLDGAWSTSFTYNDKRVATGTSSSSGPNGSSQSKSKFTETHALMNFTLSAYTEHYELVGSDWFMSSSDGAGTQKFRRSYGQSSSGSGSSVAYSGDYNGGNGTRYAASNNGSADHSEVGKSYQSWSNHTTAVPGGATTITTTASGSEEVSGTAPTRCDADARRRRVRRRLRQIVVLTLRVRETITQSVSLLSGEPSRGA